MNTKTLQLVILKHGEPITRAKVQIVGPGIDLTQTTSNKGVATFVSGSLGGKKVDVVVNGSMIKQGLEIPKDHPQGAPRATLDIVPVTAAPHGDQHAVPHGDQHAVPHGAEDEEEGYIVIVRDTKREPIEGAVVRVDKSEVYFTDENGEAIVPFFDKDTEVEISAPGYETKKQMIEADDETVKVLLTSAAKEGDSNINWMKVVWLMIALLLIGGIVYGVSRLNPGTQGVAGQTGFSLTMNLGDPITRGMMIASTVVALVIGLVGRWRVGQVGDIVLALVFVIAAAVSGALAKFHVDPTLMVTLPSQVQVAIGWLEDARLVIFWVGLAIMYAAAILNTPDFTSPGVAWDFISLVIYTTGFRMGLGFASMDDFTLVVLLKGFATLHYLADMFQLPQLILRKDVEHRFEPVVFAVLTAAFYVLLSRAIPQGWALGAVGLTAGLFAEITEEISKRLDPSNLPTGIRVVADFIKTNKADGVLIAVIGATLFALFGVK